MKEPFMTRNFVMRKNWLFLKESSSARIPAIKALLLKESLWFSQRNSSGVKTSHGRINTETNELPKSESSLSMPSVGSNAYEFSKNRSDTNPINSEMSWSILDVLSITCGSSAVISIKSHARRRVCNTKFFLINSIILLMWKNGLIIMVLPHIKGYQKMI